MFYNTFYFYFFIYWILDFMVIISYNELKDSIINSIISFFVGTFLFDFVKYLRPIFPVVYCGMESSKYLNLSSSFIVDHFF